MSPLPGFDKLAEAGSLCRWAIANTVMALGCVALAA